MELRNEWTRYRERRDLWERAREDMALAQAQGDGWRRAQRGTILRGLVLENSYIAEMWKIQFSNMGIEPYVSSMINSHDAQSPRDVLRARRALEFSHDQDPHRTCKRHASGCQVAKSLRYPLTDHC